MLGFIMQGWNHGSDNSIHQYNPSNDELIHENDLVMSPMDHHTHPRDVSIDNKENASSTTSFDGLHTPTKVSTSTHQSHSNNISSPHVISNSRTLSQSHNISVASISKSTQSAPRIPLSSTSSNMTHTANTSGHGSPLMLKLISTPTKASTPVVIPNTTERKLMTMTSDLVEKQHEIGELKKEVRRLKGHLRGTDGKVTMLRFQLEKARKAQQQQLEQLNQQEERGADDKPNPANDASASHDLIVSNSNARSTSSPDKLPWIIHWQKSRPTLQQIAERQTKTATLSHINDNCYSSRSLEDPKGSMEATLVQTSEDSLEYRLAVQERLNERLVMQMKTWVDSQVEMHRRLAESEIKSNAERKQQLFAHQNNDVNSAFSNVVSSVADPLMLQNPTSLSSAASAEGFSSQTPLESSNLLQHVEKQSSGGVKDTVRKLLPAERQSQDMQNSGDCSPSVGSTTSWDELMHYQFVTGENDKVVEVESTNSPVSGINQANYDKRPSSERIETQQTSSTRQNSFDISVVGHTASRLLGNSRAISNIEQMPPPTYQPPRSAQQDRPPAVNKSSRSISTQHLLKTFPGSKSSSFSSDSHNVYGPGSPKTVRSSELGEVPATPNTVRSAWQTWRCVEGVDASAPETVNTSSMPSKTQSIPPNQFDYSKSRSATQPRADAISHGSLSELSPASFKDQMGRMRQENYMIRDDIARFKEKLQLLKADCLGKSKGHPDGAKFAARV